MYKTYRYYVKRQGFFPIFFLKLFFLWSRYGAWAVTGTVTWQKSELERNQNRNLSKVGAGTGTVKNRKICVTGPALWRNRTGCYVGHLSILRGGESGRDLLHRVTRAALLFQLLHNDNASMNGRWEIRSGPVLRIRIRDPVPFWILTPGSGIRIRDPKSFWSGMEKFWSGIWDPV